MNILVIKLGAIGDVIMCLPAIVEYKKRHPNCKITWVSGKSASAILKATSLIDDLIIVDDKLLSSGNIWHRIQQITFVWSKLLFRKFDKTIVAYSDRRYRLLLFSLKSTGVIRQFNRNGDKGPIKPKPGIHHTYEYISLFTDEVFPSAYEVIYPKLILPDGYRLPDDKPYVAIAIGGGGSSADKYGDLRRWPVEQYDELIEILHHTGYRVVLIGGSEDEHLLKKLRSQHALSFIGKTNLLQTIDLLRGCKLLVANDAGPLHMSALAAIPALGIFGPTNPNEKIPLTPGSRFIWGGRHLSCRPCYDGKVYAPCVHNECMRSVSVNEVYREIINIITHEA